MTFIEDDDDPCGRQIQHALEEIDGCLNRLITNDEIHNEHVLFALTLHSELFKIEALYNQPADVQELLYETINNAKSNARQSFDRHQKPYFDGIHKIDSKVKRKLK